MGISKNYLCSGTSRILCGHCIKENIRNYVFKDVPAYFEGLAKVRKGNRARGK